MENLFIRSKFSSKFYQFPQDRYITQSSLHAFSWLLAQNSKVDDEPYQKLLKQKIINSHQAPHQLIKEHQMKHHEYSYDDIDRIGPKKYKSQTFIKSIKTPGLKDDFYLNLIDWSFDNKIAVALSSGVYLITGFFTQEGCIYKTQDEESLCSVSFNNSHKIGIGNDKGILNIMDLQKQSSVLKLKINHGRIGSLHWYFNCVATGSRDGNVEIFDFRHHKKIAIYCNHNRQICGLKWNEEGQYIATGSNDTNIGIFDIRKQKQLVNFKSHKAAVKALDWCPYQRGVIASGGGTEDRSIKLFDIKNSKQRFSIDSQTQICNLAFSSISHQLVTTHGYSMNQINVWSCKNYKDSLKLTRTLKGHKLRVLYLAKSPKGNSIATGAGDGTLKIWNVFESQQSQCQLLSPFDLR